MILLLTKEDKAKLQQLNKNVGAVEALKKLFLNSYTKGDVRTVDTNVLAAQRVAIELLNNAFKELARIQPDATETIKNQNVV